MSAPRPPLPPHPGRAYSDNAAEGRSRYDSHPSTSANSGHPLHYVLPRSNTTPSAPYIPESTRPPVPQRPGIRPKSAPGGPPLPPSLMPGAKRGQTIEDYRRPNENALFFEPSTYQSTRRSTVSAERSYRRPESPPPLPPPPKIFKPTVPPKPGLHPHNLSEHSVRPTGYGMTPLSTAHPMIGRHPPTSAPAILSDMPTQQSPSQSPLSAEVQLVDENDALSRALELSMADQGGKREIEEDEDEILARVLQESLASYTPTSPSVSTVPPLSNSEAITFITQASPSLNNASSSSSLNLPPSSPTAPSAGPGSSITRGPYQQLGSSNVSFKGESSDISETERRRLQMQMDEELARRLAEEDEFDSAPPLTPPAGSGQGSDTRIGCEQISYSPHENTLEEAPENTNLPPSVQPSAAPPIPRYEDATNFSHSSSSSIVPTPLHTSTPSMNLRTDLNHPASDSIPTNPRFFPPSAPLSSYPATVLSRLPLNNLGRSTSAQAIVSTPLVDTVLRATGSNSQSPVLHSARPPVTPVHRSQSANAVPSLTSAPFVAFTSRVSEPAPSITESEESTDCDNHSFEDYHSSVDSLGSRAPVPALEVQGTGTSGLTNPPPQIVEDELLMGVSFGFNAPSIGLSLAPMQGPLPNIIALPYGKCPPLHIQAPSWKHLLKLLARLSDSRIEPTVEAVAVNKTELKLRTVIQFVKVHHASSEWRAILYLSIDVPVPPQTPNAFKYINGDVSTLPFSYIMTPLPTLLRDGSDSHLAKWYSVPATIATPYPILPITLPNYALYLQAALRDSRRAMNDSSSGLRRLAKTVDMIYPPTSEHMEGLGPEASAPERHRMGNFFRRALGRGDRNSGQRGGNDESYEFITPFRIDDYS